MVANGDAKMIEVFKLVIDLPTHVCICVVASIAGGRRGGRMIHVEALTILPSRRFLQDVQKPT